MKSLREAVKLSNETTNKPTTGNLKPPKKIQPVTLPPKVETIEPAEIKQTIEQVSVVEETYTEPVTEVVETVIPAEKTVSLKNINQKIEKTTGISTQNQNRFLNAFRSMLTDSHDENAISSKRVLAFLAFIFCAIGFFVDLFTSNTITPHIYDSMMWIVIAGIGISGLEKFAPKE